MLPLFLRLLWGCLLCWLSFFVFPCLPALCCRGRGCLPRGRLLRGFWLVAVLRWFGGGVAVGRLARLWCRLRGCLSVACVGGLLLVGLSVAAFGCRLRLALVGGVGAVLCRCGLAVGVLFADSGFWRAAVAVGCRRPFFLTSLVSRAHHLTI